MFILMFDNDLDLPFLPPWQIHLIVLHGYLGFISGLNPVFYGPQMGPRVYATNIIWGEGSIDPYIPRSQSMLQSNNKG